MKAVFEIKKNAVDEFFFIFRLLDGTSIITSKSYKDRASIEKSIACIRETVRETLLSGKHQNTTHPRFDIEQVSSGYVFKLFDQAGNILLISGSYSNRALCDHSLLIFIELAVDAKLIDLT